MWRPTCSDWPSFSSPRSVALRTEIGPLPARDRSHSAPRSVPIRVEIGRTPRRDRSTSGSRSVALRTEIGPLPARDRSHSAPRSVPIRVEIGRTPHRDRSQSASRWVHFSLDEPISARNWTDLAICGALRDRVARRNDRRVYRSRRRGPIKVSRCNERRSYS